MRFRQMSVFGLQLLHNLNSQGSATSQDQYLLLPAHTRTQQLISQVQAFSDSAYANVINKFLLAMALCHTGILEAKADGCINY